MLLFKGIMTGVIASMPLGPIAILIIQRTVNKSYKSGLVSALGATTTDTLYATLAGFSLTYILTFLREFQTIFQILGGLILLTLGFYIFQKNPTKSLEKYRRRGTNYVQDYFSTMLIAVSNPMIVMIYIAIFAGTGLAFSLEKITDALQMILGFALGSITWWFILTSIINLFRHRFNLQVLWWFNKISGSVIMLFVLISAIMILINGNPKI
jgi:threonine/homoserine/homoserine lactone efflux protein